MPPRQLQLQGAFGQGAPETADVVEADEPAVPATPAAHHEPAASSDVRVLAKPPVRKLAKDLGVDLRTLTPTGPDGTVTRDDVESAGSQPQVAPVETTPDVSTSSTTRGPADRREPIKGVRKMMAQAMVDSAFTAPHVTEWITVDVTKTMRLVEKLKAHREFRDVKVSPLLVVAKAVCLAIRRTEEINATWDDRAQEVVFKGAVNLGIAAATPRGLVVPNVKGADSLTLPELGKAINALTRTAREGKTQPAEMSGGSFTITNVGVFGVDAGTPIINPGRVGDPVLRRGPSAAVGPQGEDQGPRHHDPGALVRPPSRRRREGLPVPGRRGRGARGPQRGAAVLDEPGRTRSVEGSALRWSR